jgi:thioesterase domain-containing protein
MYALEHQAEEGSPIRFKTVEAIAAHYLDEMCTVQAEGPYFLGGYCFGAVIAFEISQQLLRQGKKVALLVLLAPASINTWTLSDVEPARPFDFLRRFKLLWEMTVRHLRNLARLSTAEKLTYLSVRAISKFDEGIIALRQLKKSIHCRSYIAFGRALPISLRSNYILEVYRKALKAYRPETYPGVLTMFKGRDDTRDVSGWKTLSCGGIEIYVVPGDHDTVLKEPAVRVWAELLKNRLRKAQTNTSTKRTPEKQCALP